jgi:Ca2+/Na+ antiporter
MMKIIVFDTRMHCVIVSVVIVVVIVIVDIVVDITSIYLDVVLCLMMIVVLLLHLSLSLFLYQSHLSHLCDVYLYLLLMQWMRMHVLNYNQQRDRVSSR